MRKGCWAGLAAGGVLFLGSCAYVGKVAMSYYDFGAAAEELPAATEAYRAAGLPFVASDVAPSRLPPTKDATPALKAALAAMPDRKAEASVAAALKSPGPGADAALFPYARSFALLDKAQARPKVDFRRDWDLGPYILFPEYAGMKALTKAASLAAIRAAQKGDDAAAIRSLDVARQLAVWAGQEPTLISLLVRLSGEAIALNGAERCLVAAAGRPERIAWYARWLAAAPRPPDFGYALRGEAWLGVVTSRNLDLFGGMESLSGTGGLPKLDPSRLRRDGFPDGRRERGFMTRHLQLWTEAFRTTDGFRRPPQEISRRLDAISARTEKKRGLSYVLERILFPVFSQAGEAVTTLEARRAVQAGFAEALTTHALTGRWPARVSAIDPFTRKPLRVRPDGKGIRVWSVGRDLKDDGGLLRRELSKCGKKGEDLVAAFPPVAP